MSSSSHFFNHSQNSTKRRHRIRVTSVGVAALLGFSATQLHAAPLGEAIIQGSANISRIGTTTTVQQTSSRAVINWSSFNLAAEESVNFIVPSANDATLNRILDPNPSTISGTISSNGTVYLSNPNGLVFDATSRVSANGFVATTSAISSFEFMNSPLEPKNLLASGTAAIQLNGSITAHQVTAIGPVVGVAGTLSSNGGSIRLSSSTYSWVGRDAVISANGGCVAADCAAGTNNAGTVMVWSDGTTHYFGQILAQGGSQGGDGGTAEVSGAVVLFKGAVAVDAPHGKAGTFILDPETIRIVSQADANSHTGSWADLDKTLPSAQVATGILASGSATESWIGVDDLLGSVGTPNRLNYTNCGGPCNMIVRSKTGAISLEADLTWTSTAFLQLDAKTGISLSANITAQYGKLILNSNYADGNSDVTLTKAVSLNVKTIEFTLGTGKLALGAFGLTADTHTSRISYQGAVPTRTAATPPNTSPVITLGASTVFAIPTTETTIAYDGGTIYLNPTITSGSRNGTGTTGAAASSYFLSGGVFNYDATSLRELHILNGSPTIGVELPALTSLTVAAAASLTLSNSTTITTLTTIVNNGTLNLTNVQMANSNAGGGGSFTGSGTTNLVSSSVTLNGMSMSNGVSLDATSRLAVQTLTLTGSSTINGSLTYGNLTLTGTASVTATGSLAPSTAPGVMVASPSLTLATTGSLTLVSTSLSLGTSSFTVNGAGSLTLNNGSISAATVTLSPTSTVSTSSGNTTPSIITGTTSLSLSDGVSSGLTVNFGNGLGLILRSGSDLSITPRTLTRSGDAAAELTVESSQTLNLTGTITGLGKLKLVASKVFLGGAVGSNGLTGVAGGGGSPLAISASAGVFLRSAYSLSNYSTSLITPSLSLKDENGQAGFVLQSNQDLKLATSTGGLPTVNELLTSGLNLTAGALTIDLNPTGTNNGSTITSLYLYQLRSLNTNPATLINLTLSDSNNQNITVSFGSSLTLQPNMSIAVKALGSGTLTLNGTTDFSGGTVQLSGATVTVASGSAITTSGGGIIDITARGNLTLTTTVGVGKSLRLGTVAAAGAVTLTTTGLLTIDSLGNSGTGDTRITTDGALTLGAISLTGTAGDLTVTTGSAAHGDSPLLVQLTGTISNAGGSVKFLVWNSLILGRSGVSGAITVSGKASDSSKGIEFHARTMTLNQNLATTNSKTLIHIDNSVTDTSLYGNDLIHNNHSVTSELDLKFLARGLDQPSTLANVFVVTSGDFILPSLTGVAPATPAATVGIYTCANSLCAAPSSSPDASITQWWYLPNQFTPTGNSILSRSVDGTNLPANLGKSQVSVTAGHSTGIVIPSFTNVIFFGVNDTTTKQHYIDVSGSVKFMGSTILNGSLHITGSSTTDVALTSASGDTTSINSLTISGVRHVYMVDSTDSTTGRGTLTIAGTAAIRASGNVYLSGSEVTVNELGTSAAAIFKLATKGSSLRVSGAITGTTITLSAPTANLTLEANIGDSDTETVALKTGLSNHITIGSAHSPGVRITAKSTMAGKSVIINGSAVVHPISLQTGAMVLNQDLTLSGGKAYIFLGDDSVAAPVATGVLTTNGRKIATVNRDLYLGLASVTAAATQGLIFDLGGASGGSLNLSNTAANSLIPRAANRTIYIYGGTQGSDTVDSDGRTIDWVTLDAISRTNLPSGISYSQINHNATGSNLSDPTAFGHVALWNLNSATGDLTINATGTVKFFGNNILRNLTILSASSVTQAAGSTGSGQALIYTNRLALGGTLSLGTITGAVTLNGKTAAANLILTSAGSVALADEQVMVNNLTLGTVSGAVTIGGKTTLGAAGSGRIAPVSGKLTITQADSVTITSKLAINGELRITNATNAVNLTGTVTDFSRATSVVIGGAGSVNLNGGYNIGGNLELSTSGAVAIDGTNNVTGSLTISSSSAVTEASTASLWVDGNLTISSTGAVTLHATENHINAIGAISSGGPIGLKTNNNLYLSGNLTSVGGITLTAGSIVLRQDIVTSGGNLTMTLTGTFDSNEQVGYSLNSSGRDITMTSRGVIRKAGAIVFKLSSPGSVGTFTQTMVGLESYTSDTTVYFYSGFRKPGISGVMPDSLHSIEDLKYQGISRDQTDLTDPAKFVGSGSLDLSGKDVTFYGVLVDGSIKLTARSVNFRGSNSFGDLNLTVSGSSGVTQNSIATSLDVRGILSIDSAGAIALGNITNRIAKLGFLRSQAAGLIQINSQTGMTATGEINGASSLSLTTDGELVVNTTDGIAAAGSIQLTGKNGITIQRSGTITATGASSNLEFRSVLGNISITGTGVITVGQNLTLGAESGSLTLANSGAITVTGAMVATHGKGIELRNTGSLSAASISLSTSGGALRLTDTAAMTIGGSFSATGAVEGITFTHVGAISASGAYSLTTTGALVLGTAGTQSGSSLSFNGSSLTLTSGLTSSGGAVTIALGTGTYGNGLTDGWVWTTTNQSLDISLGRRNTKSGTVFNLGSGNMTQAYNSPIARDQPILIYGRVDPKTEGFVRYSIEEVSTPFIPFQGGVDVITTGTVTAPAQELNPLANNNQVVIDRLILPSDGRNYSLKVGYLRILGTNRFGSGGITVTGKVEVAAGARIDGNLSLGSGSSSLKIMDNVTFTGGRISGFAGGDLAVTVLGSFFQAEQDSVFDAGGHSLTIFGTGGTVRLTNPNNVFGKVGVNLEGSNLSLVSSGSLVFTSLRTAGGWVVLSSQGSITAVENVAAGNLSFRALGAVRIAGAYSGINGSGSTISLNGSSLAVVQALAASTGISIAGTGTVVLSGNLMSSGSIDISAPIGVSGNAEISASNGGITINAAIDALNSALASSLRLNAGTAGMITLGGDIGSRINLGWVAIDAARLNNPASHRISIKGASFTPSGPLDERGLRYGL